MSEAASTVERTDFATGERTDFELARAREPHRSPALDDEPPISD